ncbi:MAG: SAM-dependent chlorinase/fluorinase [Geminicoccaceae bacterium]
MILFFTDFGHDGPYMGEMRAAALRLAPEVPVVDLMADAPAFRPDLAAYLLAALWPTARPGDVVVAVVDPGVGGERAPLAVRIDGRWLVGPDNGLFEPLLRRGRAVEPAHIAWRPNDLSASFHGRDLFAPVAARLARGERSALVPALPTRFAAWPDDLPAIVYIDRYGNAVTGLRAAMQAPGTRLSVGDRHLARARTFGDMPPGEPFWYANSSGLAEIAVNAGSAASLLGLDVGSPIGLAAPPA